MKFNSKTVEQFRSEYKKKHNLGLTGIAPDDIDVFRALDNPNLLCGRYLYAKGILFEFFNQCHGGRLGLIDSEFMSTESRAELLAMHCSVTILWICEDAFKDENFFNIVPEHYRANCERDQSISHETTGLPGTK